MALTFKDLAITFAINLAIALLFLFLYSVFSVVPFNSRVYFTKWFIKDDKAATEKYEGRAERKRWSCSPRAYLHSFDWINMALSMPERELIQHAGLDMVVYLRMFKLGVKVFAPMLAIGLVVLFPVNYTSNNLETLAASNPNFVYSEVQKLSISNIPNGSDLLWVHAVCLWVFTLYCLYVMRTEYASVAQLRLDYLADQKKAANQFTVLVRQVPQDHIETVPQKSAHFFSVNHPDHYLMTQAVYDANKLAKLDAKKEWMENKLTALNIKLERQPNKRPKHKTGFLGCSGPKVDSIEFYESELEKLNKEIGEERDRVVKDKKSVMPAAFVSFQTRWAAAVAAQTQQAKDCTKWITTWAPEPRDVVWSNLPINYHSLNVRKVLVATVVALTLLFYTIPVTFVQGLASLSSLEKIFPGISSITNLPFVSSLIEGFLPGLALKIFLAILPMLLTLLSTVEGYVATSAIDRAASGKYFLFMVLTVFLGNVLAGSAFDNLSYYIQHPNEIASALGNGVPNKAIFFMTYTMVDGWAGVSSEIFQLGPLVIFHIKNYLLVRTPADRIKAMSASEPEWVRIVPQMELYFLLSLVYSVLAPLYLPFALVYFVFGFIIFRNQFINVYVDEYELVGGYWPHFHIRLVACMVVQQITMLGVFSLKLAPFQAILTIPLILITILFDRFYIAASLEPIFSKYALEEAMRKDTIDKVTNRGQDVHSFLSRAYLHPSLLSAYELLDEEAGGVGGSADGDDVPKGGSSKDGSGLKSSGDSFSNVDLEAGGGGGTGGSLVQVKRHPRSREGSPAVGRLRVGGSSGSALESPTTSGSGSSRGVPLTKTQSPVFKGVEPLLAEEPSDSCVL